MQLALTIFDELPDGFIPKQRDRIRRAIRTVSGAPIQEQQLSFLDLLTMREEDIGPINWSEEDVATLREGVLREACHTLLDNRASLSTRRDRWAWIHNDAWTPFSFKACAAACQVDYEDLRGNLVSLCRYHKVLAELQAA